jgi:uncharacterized alpha-E superfamily protein
MLARVAERVYWLARYLERAENTARLILVRHHSALDMPKDAQPAWGLLLDVLGARERFDDRPGAANEKNIISFVFGERENSSSIMSCLVSARENMRTTREILPRETWEQVNSLYLSVAQRSNRDLPRGSRYKVLSGIIKSCQQITGMLAGSMNDDAAYQFLRIGRNLERADMTTRIIDAGSAELEGDDEEIARWRNVLWISVLQSLSAYQMYRLSVQRSVQPDEVLSFLLQGKVFPRSVAHSLQVIDDCMGNLPDNRLPVKVVASAQRKLERVNNTRLKGPALHLFMDQMQLKFDDIHHSIAGTWFGNGSG